MKDFRYPPTQKRPFTVSRIGAAPTWPPAPRAVLRPSAPPMFGDTNVAPAPAQAVRRTVSASVWGLRTPHSKSQKSLAEGEGFEPPRGLRPGGFQDNSAVIPNPPLFLLSHRVRWLPTSAEVGSHEVLVDARGHRMGTPE